MWKVLARMIQMLIMIPRNWLGVGLRDLQTKQKGLKSGIMDGKRDCGLRQEETRKNEVNRLREGLFRVRRVIQVKYIGNFSGDSKGDSDMGARDRGHGKCNNRNLSETTI